MTITNNRPTSPAAGFSASVNVPNRDTASPSRNNTCGSPSRSSSGFVSATSADPKQKPPKGAELKLRRMIGKGTMKVYEVLNTTSGESYAGKIFSNPATNDSNEQKNIIRAAENEFKIINYVHQRLPNVADNHGYVTKDTHANIIKVQHLLIYEKQAVMLMELFGVKPEDVLTTKNTSNAPANNNANNLKVNGSKELAHYIDANVPKTGPLPGLQGGFLSENKAGPIFRQMFSAVLACHLCGVAHYDVKLENFLVKENNTTPVRPPLDTASLTSSEEEDAPSVGSRYYFPDEDDEIAHSDFGLEEEEDLFSEEEDMSSQATTRSPKRRLRSTACPRLKRHKTKPIQDEVTVKIIDFGFAVQYNRGEFIRCVTGSPAYASPEILFGHRHDPAVADIWSLGVCLYRMVMGKFPFCDPDKDDINKLKNNIKDHTRKPSLFAKAAEGTPESRISDELKDLLTGMLSPTDKTRLTFDQIAQHPWVLKW